MLGLLVIGGCARSLQFTALNAVAFADVVRRDMSAATALTSVAQQVSLAMGVTIAAFALEGASALAGHERIVTADFTPAFLFVAFVSALALIPFARLDADAGAEMSGHRRGGGG